MEINNHGTHSGYMRGCRCASCKAGHALEARKYYAFKNAGKPPRKKGSPTLYNQTTVDYRKQIIAELMIEQNNKCAICGREDGRLVLDHDHETLAIRGLLCYGCNTGLGKLGDSIAGLERAIKYLNKSG